VDYQKLSSDWLGEPSTSVRARAYYRIPKLACTIANLDGNEAIPQPPGRSSLGQVAEAEAVLSIRFEQAIEIGENL
jgi:hypothetical protein